MIYNDVSIAYLKGKKFSNSYSYKIRKQPHYVNIKQWHLSSILRKKKVIHFGCVDHIPLIEHKIKHNNYLHQIITESSKKCIGIDNNCEGIDFMKKKGFNNVLCIDIINDEIPEIISSEKWDYILLGEVLEHIDNPVTFLKTIHKKLNNIVKEIIITVPSALRINNFINGLKFKEDINTDHRYWFTPATLSKVVVNSGFSPNKSLMANSYVPVSFFTKILLKYFPMYCDTIVLSASF